MRGRATPESIGVASLPLLALAAAVSAAFIDNTAADAWVHVANCVVRHGANRAGIPCAD